MSLENFCLLGIKTCAIEPKIESIDTVYIKGKLKGRLVIIINKKDYELIISEKEYYNFLKFINKNFKTESLIKTISQKFKKIQRRK